MDSLNDLQDFEMGLCDEPELGAEMAIVDEGDFVHNEVRESGLRTMDFFFRGLRILAQYQGNRNMALDCFILAHGQGDMIGMHTATEVAVKHFGDPRKKAAVSKCVVMFQHCLGIPPMPGQRSEQGREQMSKMRKAQLE